MSITSKNAIYQSEAASNYEEMLVNLKVRGLDQVLLFVSDGLTGMREVILRQFSKTKHQGCWVHYPRSIIIQGDLPCAS